MIVYTENKLKKNIYELIRLLYKSIFNANAKSKYKYTSMLQVGYFYSHPREKETPTRFAISYKIRQNTQKWLCKQFCKFTNR